MKARHRLADALDAIMAVNGVGPDGPTLRELLDLDQECVYADGDQPFHQTQKTYRLIEEAVKEIEKGNP